MLLIVPETALDFGFMNDPVGTHGSRTIMLKELRLLLEACPRPTSYEDFRTAIVEDNVLLKNTVATRKESFRRLRELYALDEEILLFRALRDLWVEDIEGQPMLSLLCSTARDSILRGTAELILSDVTHHESLDNLTPADVYFGRAEEVKSRRERIKQETMEMRRQRHRQGVQDGLHWKSESSLNLLPEMSH